MPHAWAYDCKHKKWQVQATAKKVYPVIAGHGTPINNGLVRTPGQNESFSQSKHQHSHVKAASYITPLTNVAV